jgi:ATP-binding cassette, subfamily B, bacterial PglK
MNFLADIWRLLDRAQRRRVLAAQLISFLMASCTVAGIAAISPFFAVLADPKLIVQNRLLARLHGYFGGYSDHDFILLLGVGFAGMVVTANLLNGAGFYVMQRIALRIGDDMRSMLFREYLHRGVLFHAGAHSATLCGNVAYETERAIITALDSTFVLVTNVVTALLIVASVLFSNAPAAVAILSTLIGGYGVIYLAVRGKIYRAGRSRSALASARTKLILESFAAIKEISVGHTQGYFQRRFEQASIGLSRVMAGLDALTNTPRYLMESIAVCGLVSISVLLNEPRSVGQWLGQLTFLAFAVYRLLPALHQAFASVVRIRAAGASYAGIAADLKDARSRRVDAPVSAPSCNEPPPSVQLSHVSYRYKPTRRAVLQDVSLSIEPGSIVGLIGTNGSGKTTLVDILAGLLVPDSGQILVDGAVLDGNLRRRWQSRIAYVPQSTTLLDLSVEQNIALGVESKHIDQARLSNAIRLARFDEVVAGLPAGCQEVIGERGARLSGGQRQRLGIARALYANAPVLLMDEPTSALDPSAEDEVMAAIQGLRGFRTVILVTHRMNTLRACDSLYELHQGRIVRSMRSEVLRDAGDVA